MIQPPIVDPDARNLDSNNNYGAAWANVSSTPFRLYKYYAHEDGSATLFFMHWPNGIAPQAQWYRQSGQVVDVVPTALEVTDTIYPQVYLDHSIHPLAGMSAKRVFYRKGI